MLNAIRSYKHAIRTPVLAVFEHAILAAAKKKNSIPATI